jgi:hypothetical protein
MCSETKYLKRYNINKPKPYLLFILAFSFLLISMLGCGGFGLAYEKDLVGKYAVWATDIEEQAAVVKKTSSSGAAGVVPPMVFAYGWNNKFIIAKQHPIVDNSPFIVDIAITNWFIVEVKSEKIHGPLSEQEYIELRQKLGVPDALIFTESIEPSRKSETPMGKPK